MFTRPWHRIAGAVAVSVISTAMVLLPGQPSAAVPAKIAQEQSYSRPMAQVNPKAAVSELTIAATRTEPRRIRAFEWAATQKGCPYVWGGTGPCSSGYDCSGLVMKAWDHAHVILPRTTEDMAVSRHLVRIWHPARYARKGDIILFFSGGVAFHAGLVAYKNKWMLDSPHSGSVVRIERVNWGTPVFYRVRR